MTRRRSLRSKQTLEVSGRGTVKVVGDERDGLGLARSLKIGDAVDVDGEPWTVAGVEMPFLNSDDVHVTVKPRRDDVETPLPVEIGNHLEIRGGGSGRIVVESAMIRVMYWYLKGCDPTTGFWREYLCVSLSIGNLEAARVYAFEWDEIQKWELVKTDAEAVLTKIVALLQPQVVLSVIRHVYEDATEAGIRLGRTQAGEKIAELLEFCDAEATRLTTSR